MKTKDLPWEKDIHYTSKIIKEYLETELDIEINDISLLGEGWDNSAFIVNNKLVFRFAHRTEGIKFIKSELIALPMLKSNLTLKTPHILYNGIYKEKWPWIGYDMLPGLTGDKAMLSEEDRIKSAPTLAGFLKNLHSLDISQFKTKGLPGDWVGILDLKKRIPKALKEVKYCIGLNYIQDQPYYKKIISEVESLHLDNTKVLSHGDLKTVHLLFNHKELTGVIDWGDVHVGHPASDLSIAYSFIPAKARDLFWENYGEVKPEWKKLARFRALYHMLGALQYGHCNADQQLIKEIEINLSYLVQE